MKTAVVRFPGSNCEQDCFHVLSSVFNKDTDHIWHKDSFNEKDYDLIVLPGGFSFGDHLRCGAIARFSPVMQSVIAHAKRGGYIIGICNGFQVLTEAHLLPGALIRNESLKFICKNVYLRVENAESLFTKGYKKGELIRVPVAHGEGNYRADDDLIKELEDENRILFRYSNAYGEINEEANINGSVSNIAGIMNESGRILGMMPHPERVSEEILGGTDGYKLFDSLFTSLA